MLTVVANATTLDRKAKSKRRFEPEVILSQRVVVYHQKLRKLVRVVSTGFYNTVAQELIEEWISNKRFIEEELDDRRIIDRTVALRSMRGEQNEPPSFENRLAPA